MSQNRISEGARGSSQSLINIFLLEIDTSFAHAQFERYKNVFLDHRLGIIGVREYPIGKEGLGDVDSGPVIWGMGGSASIVAMGAMRKNLDVSTSQKIAGAIETFAFPYTWNGKKRYLVGQLPIADEFIAWTSSL